MTRDGLRVALWFVRSLAERRRRLLATPVRRWLPMLARGFYPDRFAAYGLDRHDPGSYMSDIEVLRTFAVNGARSIALSDKLLFESLMPPAANVPRTLAVVRHGRPVWLRDPRPRGLGLGELVAGHEAVLAKPCEGLGGDGIRLLEHRDGGFRLDGRPVGAESVDWAMLGPRETLVCEVVRQGAFAARLYPRTVNTVRAVTMLDPHSGLPFVAAALQRIGTAESFPVDNASAGGIFCNLDLDTGRLDRGVADWFRDRPLRWLDRHPDTGAVLAGQTIPRWREVCAEVLELAARLPSLPYVAWDVALLDDGIAVIEGNHWSELGWFQLARPLLADPRVRAFFAHHGVVAPATGRTPEGSR